MHALSKLVPKYLSIESNFFAFFRNISISSGNFKRYLDISFDLVNFITVISSLYDQLHSGRLERPNFYEQAGVILT